MVVDKYLVERKVCPTLLSSSLPLEARLALKDPGNLSTTKDPL